MPRTRKSYEANVTRDGEFWLIRIDGVGVTQARRLGEIDAMARDLIATMLDVPSDSFGLVSKIELPAEVRAALELVEAKRKEAAEAQAAAAAASRKAARSLHDDGVTYRDIGEVLGISYQRAHQLVS